MPRLDAIADCLANPMIAEHQERQIVAGQQIELVLAVIVVAQRPLHFEVIAPAAQLQPLIAPVVELLREFFERQMRPLSAKEQHRPRHASSSVSK